MRGSPYVLQNPMGQGRCWGMQVAGRGVLGLQLQDWKGWGAPLPVPQVPPQH